MPENEQHGAGEAVEAHEVGDIESALTWIRDRVTHLLATGTPRPVCVKVLGYPNAGKSHLIREYVVRFGQRDEAGRIQACLWDDQSAMREEHWNLYAARADVAFVHDAGVVARPDVRGVRDKNRPYDIIVYVYNPAMHEAPTSDFRKRVQLILRNEASQAK